MEATNFNTILAYLLALRDFSGDLSDAEKSSLKVVARDLELQPIAWNRHIKPALMQTIAGNSQLNTAYQSYKEKLDQAGAMPAHVWTAATESDRPKTQESTLVEKGFIPEAPAAGYEQQLNNVVIAVNLDDKPEEAVKQIDLLDRVQHFLDPN
jgi:hypothetical protein